MAKQSVQLEVMEEAFRALLAGDAGVSAITTRIGWSEITGAALV